MPVLLGLLAISAARPARGTSGTTFGIGPRSVALAGAGATVITGYEASLANPAELAAVSAPDLDLGYGATRFSLSVSPQSLSVPADGSGSALFGFTLPLYFAEQRERRLVLGFAGAQPFEPDRYGVAAVRGTAPISAPRAAQRGDGLRFIARDEAALTASAGIANTHGTLVLRVGYAFEASPVPARQSETHFLDTDRQLLSLVSGVTLNPDSPWLPEEIRLDAHLLWVHYAQREAGLRRRSERGGPRLE